MQHPQRGVERGLARIGQYGRIGKTDVLDQLRAGVERVHQLRHAVCVIAAHEAEDLRLARVGKRVHSITAVSASGRKL